MNFIDILEKKKNGKSLNKEEIKFFVNSVTDGGAEDYQLSAMLMAMYINKLTENETYYLTDAMLRSGEILKKGNLKGFFADKHSTGGVSDSTTLVVVPVIASLGFNFCKLSGRGLGHTGGTLDKLEAFDGFNVNLTSAQIEKQISDINCVIAGQTQNIAPADKKLYALRDVTATVDSPYLIAASVMSKKLASFCDIILLDVKYGSGAFMKSKKEAEYLAKIMVNIGKNAGRKTAAVISSMQQPLGSSVGTKLEALEAIEVLKGNKNDLYDLSFYISCKILELFGYNKDNAAYEVEKSISGGKALSKLKELIEYQGGNFDINFKPKQKKYLYSEKRGYITAINAENIGRCATMLGCGRLKKDDIIDHDSGIVLKIRINDYVNEGDMLATLYTSDKKNFAGAGTLLLNSFKYSDVKGNDEELVYKYIQ